MGDKCICLAFDALALTILSNIHAKNKENKYPGYYKRILELIYDGKIKPVILETVYREVRGNRNVKKFISQHGYFIKKSRKKEDIKKYEETRDNLANEYGKPFVYNRKEYNGPFEYIPKGCDSKLAAKMSALVVADAVINDCPLIVADESRYIHKNITKFRCERVLGIRQINFNNGYYKLESGRSILPTTLPFRVEIIEPIAIETLMPWLKYDTDKFSSGDTDSKKYAKRSLHDKGPKR